MREANNNAGGFDPTSATGLFQQSSSRLLWNPSKTDFGPRLGIAWDVTGKATTVVRAGGGVFYEPFVTQLSTSQETAWATPTGATLVLANGTKIPGPGNLLKRHRFGRVVGFVDSNQLAGKQHQPRHADFWASIPSSPSLSCGNGVAPNPAVCNLGVVAPNIKMAIVGEWNFGIQRAISNSITLDVSYVGNHGAWGTGALDQNQPTPGVKANETATAAVLQPVSLSWPDFDRVQR